VELLASGEAGEVDDFLQALRESTLAGHIDNESTEEIAPPGGLRGFEIRA
jgi:hypothetical protein